MGYNNIKIGGKTTYYTYETPKNPGFRGLKKVEKRERKHKTKLKDKIHKVGFYLWDFFEK